MNPNPEMRAAIVAAYREGARILDIEQRFEVNRSTLYYVLDQAGVLPDRANRGEKLKGNTEQLAALFELLSAQETYVASLEKLLNDNGITIPEKFLG